MLMSIPPQRYSKCKWSRWWRQVNTIVSPPTHFTIS